MAVRVGEYKLRYYTEQLPFDNYSSVHCTNGWAHGEFFQGGWTCHGGSVTTNSPPQLFRISSDPSERFDLLGSGSIDWKEHLARVFAENAPSPRLPYYSELPAQDIQSARRHLTKSIFHNKKCDSNFTIPHSELSGYRSFALEAGIPFSEMVTLCQEQCCNDTNCSAFVMQPYSLNHGLPRGACRPAEPCCWLVDSENANQYPTASVNASVGYPRGDTPVGPSSGPYAQLLAKIHDIVERHLASMTRGTIPNSGHNSVGPCCSNDENNCGCNYPGRAP